jgi:chromosome partitioning protein
VLVIDYDPQFNLSQALLTAKAYFDLETKRKTTISILVDDDANLNPYQLQVPGSETPPSIKDIGTSIFSFAGGGLLDIVPSTLDLMYVALGQFATTTKPMEARFAKFIDECRQIYDVILIDCHPAGSIFTKTSLQNSDHVLIPVVPQRYAVRGIGLMMQFIEAKNPIGAGAVAAHILFNATPRTGATKEESDIRANGKYSPLCLQATLKRYTAFTDPEGGKGFVWHSRKPWSTEALRNLLAVSREFALRIGV